MTRVDEFEAPGASDTVPETTKSILSSKPTLEELTARTNNMRDPNYQPVKYDERPTTTLTKELNLTQPSEYFKLFIPDEQLECIATYTNKNASNRRTERFAEQREREVADGESPGRFKARDWTDTTGGEIGVFVGVMLLTGVDKVARMGTLWGPHTDTGRSPDVCAVSRLKSGRTATFTNKFGGKKAMSQNRWQNIKSHLKISNPETDPPDGSDVFLAKVQPLLDHFRAACRRWIRPGRDVSVDEQLIQCKCRCKHTMNIAAKAAGVGFKIYSLCADNYLFDFRFASKITAIEGIPKIRKKGALPETSRVVVELLKALPSHRHVVFVDNFFTKKALFSHLRSLGFGACGTAKMGSGIPPTQVAIKEISQKSKHWGHRTVTTNADALSLTWQDNNTVMMMTTAHTVEESWITQPFDPRRRKDIPHTSYGLSPDGGSCIAFPKPVVDYNKHMGGSDGNAQQRAEYSDDHHSDRRWWWKLFLFIIHAAALNAWLLYQLDHPDSKIERHEFLRLLAIEYIRNPTGQQRKQMYSFGNDNPKIPEPQHRWQQSTQKRTCDACRKAHRSRPALRALDRNVVRRARPAQTSWGCTHPRCQGLYACKKQECWEGIHAVRRQEVPRLGPQA